jgi:hypothetical protein
MRRTRFFLAGILSLCLAVGVGLIGCGGDEGTFVPVDLCTQSLQAMDSQDCREEAYAGVDVLKDCLVDCGPADDTCQKVNCLSVPGAGFSECSVDVDVAFLFSGECGVCYENCGLDFVGDEGGCLFEQSPTGTQCLNTLYDCVGQCAE